MKFYILAGEASGDLHGSNLVKELRAQLPHSEFAGWGGDLLAAQGVKISKHIAQLAFMGFTQVLSNMGTILQNFRDAKAEIESWKPDAIIFIDYPGFNLRMCAWAKLNGYRTVYYISPQIWAWKESRVKIIRQSVDLMLVILPFEEAFYQKHGVKVTYIGHPLLDAISPGAQTGVTQQIALLPGSRRQEVRSTLPIMAAASSAFTRYKAVVAQAPALSADLYSSMLGNSSAQLVQGRTHQILAQSRVAAVTSGTATLESGVIGTPQVVCYRAGNASVWLAKRLIKVKFISLVNLILDRELVPELIQHKLNADTLRRELESLMEGPKRQVVLAGYQELRQRLGDGGASGRAASAIADFIR